MPGGTRHLRPPLGVASCPRHLPETGLEFLRQRQFPSGEFSTLTWFGDDIENNARYDGSLFATTFVLYSLGFIAEAGVREMREKGLDFLEREMLPGVCGGSGIGKAPTSKKCPTESRPI